MAYSTYGVYRQRPNDYMNLARAVVFAVDVLLVLCTLIFANQLLYWFTGAALVVSTASPIYDAYHAHRAAWMSIFRDASFWIFFAFFIIASVGYLLPLQVKKANAWQSHLRPFSIVEDGPFFD